jgi:membrane fusion protein (multidrug efflux system)
MKTKMILQLVGLAVLLTGIAGAGWTANHLWKSQSSSHAEDGDSAGRESDKEGVVCIGYVDVEHGVRTLAPLRPGRVVEVLVHENQTVEAGQPLLRLDEKDAKFQAEEAESVLEAASAQVEQANQLARQQRAQIAGQQAAIEAAGLRVDAARRMLRHKEDQRKDNLATDYEVAMTRDEVKALEALERAEREKLAALQAADPAPAVRKARADLKRARTRREQARHQLDECTLKAPAAGTVQRIGVGVGDVLTGQPGQPVVQFRAVEPLFVRAEVDQEFADRVTVGQTALVKDDARSGTAWHGKVERVAGWYGRRRPNPQDPTAFTDIRAIECLITIDPGQPPLRIGQRMRVLIGPVPATTGD